MDGLLKRTDGKLEEAQAVSGGMPRRSLRNIALLAVCQALTQSSNTLMFASSALAVLTIVSPDMRMWANLPVTMQHLGVMLAVFPASLLMMRVGLRIGFRVGSLAGMVGSACVALGLGLGSFPVMCGGGLILGVAVANMQLYRFAAVGRDDRLRRDVVRHGRLAARHRLVRACQGGGALHDLRPCHGHVPAGFLHRPLDQPLRHLQGHDLGHRAADRRRRRGADGPDG